MHGNVGQKRFFNTSSCCCLVAKLFVTLCDPINCSMPGFPVLHYLPEFAQTHADWSIIPSNHLILCHPLLLLSSIFPSIRFFFPWNQFFASGGQSIAASAPVLPVNIQDWFPLGLIGWISLQLKGLLRVFSNTSLKALILQCSAFFMIQLSYPYMTAGKTIVWLYGPLSTKWCLHF